MLRNILILAFIVGACSGKDFKWQIIEKNYQNTGRDAYFLCDTFSVSGDTFYWVNSDSTVRIISTDSCKNCIFKKLK
jgi:hypothetical protein